MATAQKISGQSPIQFQAEERDHLYREWVVPYLSLSDKHQAFADEYLRVLDGHGLFTFPGKVRIPLPADAPGEQLKSLPGCTVRGDSLNLAGPRDGCLLLPVQNPQNQIIAFQCLMTSQIEKIQHGESPGAVRWWHATGTIKPMLPCGEMPLHAERVHTSNSVVLSHSLAHASAIAGRWHKHAISATEGRFPRNVLNDYLHEYPDVKKVHILYSPRSAKNKDECLQIWKLVLNLHKDNWETTILVPLLSELDLPDSFTDCSAIPPEAWLNGLPRATKNHIMGKSGNAGVNHKLQRLNERRQIAATTKLTATYEDIIAAGDTTSISGLAKAADISYTAAKEILGRQGINSTSSLRVAMSDRKKLAEPPPMPPPIDDATEDDEEVHITAKALDEQTLLEELPLFAAVRTPDSESEASPHIDEDQDTRESPDLANDRTGEASPTKEEPGAEPKSTKKEAASPSESLTNSEERRPAETQEAPAQEQPQKDATLELVVQAKESIYEGERAFTQTMPKPEADPEEEKRQWKEQQDSIAKAQFFVVGVVILIIAGVLVYLSGQLAPKPTNTNELIEIVVPFTDDTLLNSIPMEELPTRYHKKMTVEEIDAIIAKLSQ